jgi:hypothetical protein
MTFLTALMAGVLFFSVAPTHAQEPVSSPKPVLLILRGDDRESDTVQAVIEGRTKDARAIYEKAGFEVKELFLPRSMKTPKAAFENELGTLATAPEIHLLILAHGNADADRVFLMQGNLQDESQRITGKNIKEVLKNVLSTNPSLHVYCSSVSCFGGALGIQLADVPRAFVMSSSGATQSTVLTEESDPIKTYLGSLDNHKNYETAQELAWQEQFNQMTKPSAVFAGLLIDKEEALSLPRSGTQLFLETWCAARTGMKWATGQFCVPTADITLAAPDALKVTAIHGAQSINEAHLKKINDVKAKIPCKGDNPFKAQFNVVRLNTVKKALSILEDAINRISLPDFKINRAKSLEETLESAKNGTTSLTESDIQTQLNYCKSIGENQFKSWKEVAKEQVKIFKKNCLATAKFDPKLKFKYGDVDTSCGSYFNYQMDQSWHLYVPEVFTQQITLPQKTVPVKKADATKSQAPLPMSEVFSILSKERFEYYRDASELSPVIGAMAAMEIEFPTLKDYCDMLDASIKQVKEDIACTKQFMEAADANEWARLLDLEKLGQRKLLP